MNVVYRRFGRDLLYTFYVEGSSEQLGLLEWREDRKTWVFRQSVYAPELNEMDCKSFTSVEGARERIQHLLTQARKVVD